VIHTPVTTQQQQEEIEWSILLLSMFFFVVVVDVSSYYFSLGFVWTMAMTMTMTEVSCCVPFANFSIVYKLPLLLYYYGTTRQR